VSAAALPETVGDSARLFGPHDPEAIAQAVVDVLATPTEWSRRGLERAACFSWEETARATDAVYRALL
jgi:glycosyltransferase involved in cell wall biosynthesis